VSVIMREIYIIEHHGQYKIGKPPRVTGAAA
jgi:hypothetical protein